MQKSHPLIVPVLLASVASRAEAAVLCVNPGGVGGCFAAIQDALNAPASATRSRLSQGSTRGTSTSPRPGSDLRRRARTGPAEHLDPA